MGLKVGVTACQALRHFKLRPDTLICLAVGSMLCAAMHAQADMDAMRAKSRWSFLPFNKLRIVFFETLSVQDVSSSKSASQMGRCLGSKNNATLNHLA